MIAVKEFQKTGLGSGGSFAAKQAQVLQEEIQVIEIEEKILQPEGAPFSNAGWLSWLKMGKSQGWHTPVFFSEASEVFDHCQQFAAYQLKGLRKQQQIGIIANITGRRPQMNDWTSQRALFTIGVNMRHHIMTNLFFPGGCDLVIDIILKLLQFGNLFRSHWQTQFLFGLSQSNPQFTPCSKFFVSGKNILHFLAGIAC